MHINLSGTPWRISLLHELVNSLGYVRPDGFNSGTSDNIILFKKWADGELRLFRSSMVEMLFGDKKMDKFLAVCSQISKMTSKTAILDA